MKSSVRDVLGCLVLTSLLAFAACSDEHEDDGHGHADAALVCQVMGELCHAADTGEGPASECHEIGHVGDGEACEAAFAGCMEVCLSDEGGEGGEGGGAGSEQDPYCAALGELCHAVDDEDGPTHECHELGHVNDADACLAGFDDCATLCLAAGEDAEG